MMRQWRLIYDKPTTGRYNMAIDEAIMAAVAERTAPPTLRLYAWEPACLSLGYSQKTTDADQARIAAQGWDIVRRPTGGKAILHMDELTYSVALPDGHPIAEGGIIESYRRISTALMIALESLGTHPESKRREDRARSLGPVCFEVPSHYEVTVNTRKLVGSAQVRRKNSMLQHGTLPLFGDVARICDALVYDDEASRESARIAVRQRATSLSAALDREITWDQAAEAVVAGFREAFDIDFKSSQLTESETEQMGVLAKEKYTIIEKTHKR